MKIKFTLISIFLAFIITVKAQEDAQLVTISPAISQSVQSVMWLPGNVISRLNAEISAEQSGQLLSIADIGSQVKKGTVIARLDNRNLQIRLNQLKAQERQIQANVTYLQKQQNRMDKLAENYGASVSDIDRNQRDLMVAKEELKAMNAQIELTELDIEKTQVKAPFDGTINAHFASLGELVTISSPLLQLVDTEHLDILVATPLNMSKYIAQVDQAQVKWNDELIVLPIRAWSSAGNQTSRTFDLRLDASGLDLFSGSAVQVSLPKSFEINAVTIPRDGLILREKESYVFIVDDAMVAHKVNVQIGLGVGDWVVVEGDLMPGDHIITRGGERLTDGQSVRLANDMAVNNKTESYQLIGDAG